MWKIAKNILIYFNIHIWKYYTKTYIIKHPYKNKSFKHTRYIRECKLTGLKQRRKWTTIGLIDIVKWVNLKNE